ncbi:unnamed protein product, partial [Amoebophrya sp. A25]
SAPGAGRPYGFWNSFGNPGEICTRGKETLSQKTCVTPCVSEQCFECGEACLTKSPDAT